MKKIPTVFLQAVVILVAILALFILLYFPPKEGRAVNLSTWEIYSDPFILLMYVASIPFFVALFNAFKLLGFIGQNKVFSISSVKTLKNIKICALLLGVFIISAAVFIKFNHAKEDDPAGFLGLCIVTTFVSIVVATAAAIFEKVLQNAVEIKSENDLTV